jgi:nicotinate-nucleotide pyrophosphorylase (carboxylating)
MTTPLPDIMIEPIVRAALMEDLGRAGDVTARASLAPDAAFSAHFRARQTGVVSGLQAARIACALVDDDLHFTPHLEDGARVERGAIVAAISGPASSVMIAERTALNFLTHLSGVATLTRAFVDAIAGTHAKIAATRKTLPGLRIVQKQAVIHGGGWPHRFGLDDAVLIKDNHIAAAGGVGLALHAARERVGHMVMIEVEVDSLTQLDEALPYRPNVVLLDNFALADLKTAVTRAQGQTILEASGGVRLESVRAIAGTGVDVISVGALTHSAPALDIGLDAG